MLQRHNNTLSCTDCGHTLNDAYLAMIWEQAESNGLEDCEAYAVHDALSGCCPGRRF